MAGTLWQLVTTIAHAYSGGVIQNMWGYKSNLPIIDEANQLLNEFEAQVMPDWLAVLSNASDFIAISALDTGNPANFLDRTYTPTTHVGGRSGEVYAPFAAWKFQLLRAVRGQRSGYKRFGLISESDVNGGVPYGTIITPLNTLAATLKAPIKLALIDTWFPVILERPATPGGLWGYHDFSQALARGVTTQNSRKR